MEIQPIYTMDIANGLLEEGFKLIRIEKNINNNRYLVFLFEKTEKLVEHLKSNYKIG